MDVENLLASIFSSDREVVELIEADSKVVPRDTFGFPPIVDERARYQPLYFHLHPDS